MDKLLKLGYTNLWLELGLLTEQQLEEQLIEFEENNDDNTEHYRYQIFRNYLTTKQLLTDTELDNYLKVANSENDIPIKSSALCDILQKTQLTDLQFDKVCSKVTEFGIETLIKKAIPRQVLLRRLKSENLTDGLFAESLRSNDSIVQQFLLNLAAINQLEQMAKNGATKSIRNVAIERNKVRR
jgi:hypothetical protein